MVAFIRLLSLAIAYFTSGRDGSGMFTKLLFMLWLLLAAFSFIYYNKRLKAVEKSETITNFVIMTVVFYIYWSDAVKLHDQVMIAVVWAVNIVYSFFTPAERTSNP